MKRVSLLFAAAIFFAIFSVSLGEAGSPPLPKGKTIAVLVKGTQSHAAAARSILLKGLIDGGYRAVDEKQLERIRRSKAAALALEGNVEAILKLGRTYGFPFFFREHGRTETGPERIQPVYCHGHVLCLGMLFVQRKTDFRGNRICQGDRIHPRGSRPEGCRNCRTGPGGGDPRKENFGTAGGRRHQVHSFHIAGPELRRSPRHSGELPYGRGLVRLPCPVECR